MLRARKTRFTPAEYLAMETVADYKSQYYNGEIFAMWGRTPDHSLIAVNIAGGLGQRLAPTPCRVFNSDMRLNVERSGLYTYPDVMVICGKVELVKGHNDTVTNPILSSKSCPNPPATPTGARSSTSTSRSLRCENTWSSNRSARTSSLIGAPRTTSGWSKFTRSWTRR